MMKFRIYSKLDGSFSYLNFEDALAMLQDGKLWRIHRQVDVNKDDIVIQQFINELDSNNKEIYDGDIVEYYSRVTHEMKKGIIMFSRYFTGWSIDDCEKLNDSYPLKVVGNIFENLLDS